MEIEKTSKKPYTAPIIDTLTFEGDVICNSKDTFASIVDGWKQDWNDNGWSTNS